MIDKETKRHNTLNYLFRELKWHTRYCNFVIDEYKEGRKYRMDGYLKRLFKRVLDKPEKVHFD